MIDLTQRSSEVKAIAGAAELISGDALKTSAREFLVAMQAKITKEQGGLPSVFDSWFSRTLTQLLALDADRPWEDCLADGAAPYAAERQALRWDLMRLRLFLDRWQQGRFVDYARREQSGAFYHPRFGTEFGADVLLTCQGAPSLMRWRGRALMKNVFDFAMYPTLLAELRPRTVFEIGSGQGASAAWFADLLAFEGTDGHVHSVDIVEPTLRYPRVTFHRGDCNVPDAMLPAEILRNAPHPWLVVEDAHQNVAGVLDHFHRYLSPGDYLIVEDSDVKRDVIRAFIDKHPGEYLVDTRFTDNFGRNATCAADSIFARTKKIDNVLAPQKEQAIIPADKSAPRDVNIVLGDPAPWFGAPIVGGSAFNLQVAAGRWIVLSFPGTAERLGMIDDIEALLREVDFDDDHVIFCVVITAPPCADAQFLPHSSPAVSVLADYDGVVSRLFGAEGLPRTIVLDPLLRTIANIPWNAADNHATKVRDLIRSLPAVDNSAGVPLTAPVLIVPRVFDFPLCETLVRVFDELGGDESGFLLDVDGRTARVVDHRLKRRSDLVVVHPVLREAMRSQIVRRLLPAIERFLQFRATRLDRYIVSCYDSAVAAHFHRHRDNDNLGAQHRRFAVTINLNKDYDGGDLVFPEFGRRAYRAPIGGAAVFSCGALHQVMPVTRGRRYAFLAFLYGEADAALREANNAKLHLTAAKYVTDSDLLFPEGSEQRVP